MSSAAYLQVGEYCGYYYNIYLQKNTKQCIKCINFVFSKMDVSWIFVVKSMTCSYSRHGYVPECVAANVGNSGR